MRHIPDHYVYANPFLEPVSLEALASSADADDEAESPYIPDPSVDAENGLAEAETAKVVRAFVASLGATDRTLIESVFWREESQADVARAMGVSNAAISKRMARIVALGRIMLGSVRDGLVLH